LIVNVIWILVEDDKHEKVFRRCGKFQTGNKQRILPWYKTRFPLLFHERLKAIRDTPIGNIRPG